MSDSCKCGEESEVGALVTLSCRKCSQEVEKFEIRKPVKAAAIAALLAYSGSSLVTYAVTDNRYPLAVESEVVQACLSSYDKPMAYRIYDNKREVCLCALEDTMNQISYVRYNVDESGFLDAFDENAEACSE